jgi:dihydrolipoamide dehydrogenase
MLVVGAGDTGLQVASIFNAFGSRIQLLEAGPRILPHADDDVAAAIAAAFRGSGMVVQENYGAIESFEKTATGVRMITKAAPRRRLWSWRGAGWPMPLG